MKALTIQASREHRWELAFANKTVPEPGHSQCLVKIRAAALNRRDYWISVGKYPGIKSGTTMGSDACGEVIQGVDAWVGKRVWINPNINWGEKPAVQSGHYSILGTPEDGTLAEYITVNEDRLVEAPPHLTDEEAAACPLAALTAYRAVFSKARIASGQKVLVTGIGGGVSQFAMSFARATGAKVYVNSSAQEKINQAIKLGATAGFNYRHPEWVQDALREVGKFDAIIDSAGGNALNDYLKLIRPGGKIVVYGSTTGKPQGLDLFRLFWSQAAILGSTMGNDEEFLQMTEFVGRHQIKPVISQVYPFDQAIAAIHDMSHQNKPGKIVVRF